eukprot:1503194-Prorocentrum_lima.AAC.1
MLNMYDGFQQLQETVSIKLEAMGTLLTEKDVNGIPETTNHKRKGCDGDKHSTPEEPPSSGTGSARSLDQPSSVPGLAKAPGI